MGDGTRIYRFVLARCSCLTGAVIESREWFTLSMDAVHAMDAAYREIAKRRRNEQIVEATFVH